MGPNLIIHSFIYLFSIFIAWPKYKRWISEMFLLHCVSFVFMISIVCTPWYKETSASFIVEFLLAPKCFSIAVTAQILRLKFNSKCTFLVVSLPHYAYMSMSKEDSDFLATAALFH